MAYMSQDRKAEFAPKIKALCAKFGVKGTLSVNNHSTIVLTLSQGKVDFLGSYAKMIGEDKVDQFDRKYLQVNHYHLDRSYEGDALAFLKEAKTILSAGNHDRSDIMTDHFDVGWYIDLNVGRWDKPYVYTGGK